MTFNRFAGLGTLHALRTLVFRSRIAWLRRFPGAGNASRKPETTVTEATTAGRGDNCGEVHNGRGRVGPRGRNRPPCSTKSSSAGCEWRIVVAVLISSRPVSARELALGLRLDYGFVKRIVRGLVAWRILSATPEGLSVQPDATRWAAAPAGGRQR